MRFSFLVELDSEEGLEERGLLFLLFLDHLRGLLRD